MTSSPARPQLRAPFFEVGPKNLLRLPEVIEVARAAERAGSQHDVTVVLTVPAPLITSVRTAVPGVLVFAQGMAADGIGPTVGRVIAESLVDAGADGVMLNHDSNPLRRPALQRSIERAAENGLSTMVCVGSESQALELAPLGPSVVLFEPPELIGHAGGGERPWIRQANELMHAAAPEILMMHAGGVGSPADAYRIMSSGAAGTGSTSGVLRDESPVIAVARFIEATRAGFNEEASRVAKA